jgi:cytochrome c oxidase cbb3-type subunit 4
MSLDVTTLRIAATLVSFATFIAICAWACARSRHADFEEAARLPLNDD